MQFRKTLALSLASLLIVSIVAIALPVEAQQQHIKTQLVLGVARDVSDPAGGQTGGEDTALPALVRVGETRLVNGRLMQLPDGRNLQPLPNAEVKLIDVFNNAQNPVVLATATSDSEGFFVFEWKVSAKEFKKLGVYKLQEGITSIENLRLQILAVYDGDDTHAKTTSRGYLVDLKPLRLTVNIKTDKQLYTVNERAQVTITFKDPDGKPVDPDTLEVFFKSTAVSPVRRDVGIYFFATPPLSENIHMVTVLADKEEFLSETITSTITASTQAAQPVDLDIRLDQEAYGLGDFIMIDGTVDPVMEGKVILINVVNPNGSTFNFGRVVPDADGSFKYEFALVGPLAVQGEWKATVTYLGFQSANSFAVGELETKLPMVAVASSGIVNDKGGTLSEGSLGAPVGIQTELANREKKEVALTYIVQVKDAQGFTVMVSWIKGIVLKPDTSTKPAIFWIPDVQGRYDVQIFVWQSIENPAPLSMPKTMTINVA